MRILGVSVNDDLEEQKTASISVFTGCPVPSQDNKQGCDARGETAESF